MTRSARRAELLAELREARAWAAEIRGSAMRRAGRLMTLRTALTGQSAAALKVAAHELLQLYEAAEAVLGGTLGGDLDELVADIPDGGQRT